MKSRQQLITTLILAAACIGASNASAQTPGVLYTFPSGTQDWFKNFGAGTGTLGNSGGALTITETSATPGTAAAWTDGFNTIRDNAPFTIGCCGGIDLTGLSALEFDLGHNGANPVNVNSSRKLLQEAISLHWDRMSLSRRESTLIHCR